MNEKRCLARGRHLPERLQIGVVEHAGGALGLGADHRAVEALVERVLENPRGKLARLHWHGCQRDKKWNPGSRLEHMLIEKAAPFKRFIRRQVVAEHVEPTANRLFVNAAVGEPYLSPLNVAHAGRHRPFCLLSRENKTHTAVLDADFYRREETPLRCHIVEQRLRNEMSMGIDDHLLHAYPV